VFRPGLLEGVAVALAGPARAEIATALADLGAETRPVAPASDEDAPPEAGGVAALVVDSAAAFTATEAGGDELAPLRAAADGAWIATRAVANAAWIGPGRPGGKVVFVAPRPADGPHAEAARAALENLARTLSIEWARYGVRTTTITPGAATTDEDVASLVAYLVSAAGDYFSGARLDLA
jgi:NAD(P)-dependent dehydrogenase (short-subunit alcohol dehydrogenase family)